nr:DUF1799 domain-containing protein [Paracidovorax cattleyae]
MVPVVQQKPEPDDFDLWPEHALAWKVYTLCRTQWRKSPIWTGGPMGGGQLVWVWEGLDYSGVDVVMRRFRIPEDEQAEAFELLQILEAETLAVRNRSE